MTHINTQTKNRFKGVSLAVAGVSLTLLLTVFSTTASNAVKYALDLCFSTLIPTLFPFFVAGRLLSASGAFDAVGKLFRAPFRFLFASGGSCAAAVIMGLVSGFPSGAITMAELYDAGLCDKDEAERLMCLCNPAGPGFVVCTVGGAALGSLRLGGLIFLFQLFAAVLYTIIIRKRNFSAKPTPTGGANRDGGYGVLSRAIGQSALSVINVCATVIFFSCVCSIATDALTLSTPFSCSIGAFLEISGGVDICCSLLPPDVAFIACGAAVGWSGLSVHTQVRSAVAGRFDLKKYYIGKLFCSVFTAAACFVCVKSGIL